MSTTKDPAVTAVKDAPVERRNKRVRLPNANAGALKPMTKEEVEVEVAPVEAEVEEKFFKETKPTKKGKFPIGLSHVAIHTLNVLDGFNPRSDLGDLTVLTASIAQHGLIQPILVREIDEKLHVVCGHRRLQASINAGILEVDVVNRNMSDIEALAIAISENSEDSRTKLTPMDEAMAFKRLKDSDPELDAIKIGKICGCHAQKVRTSLKMLEAPDSIQKAVREGKLGKYAVVELQQMTPELRTKALPEVIKRSKELAASGKEMTKVEVRKIGNDIRRSEGVASTLKGKSSEAGFAESLGIKTIWRGKSEMKDAMYKIADLLLDARDTKEDCTFLEGAFAAFMYCSGLSDQVKVNKVMEQALTAIDKELAQQSEKGVKK